MEKRIQRRLLQILGLAALLALAGCVTQPTVPTQADSAPAPAKTATSVRTAFRPRLRWQPMHGWSGSSSTVCPRKRVSPESVETSPEARATSRAVGAAPHLASERSGSSEGPLDQEPTRSGRTTALRI